MDNFDGNNFPGLQNSDLKTFFGTENFDEENYGKEKFGYVIATKVLVENNLPVLYAYREAARNPQDSGWRFFAGIESQAYVDDPENSEIYYATTILDVDGSVRPLLDIPAPCAFMREDPDESFRVWDDFFQN